MVISKHGIAATSQTLASQAAAQVLARGGSAADAAIAANAVLGLVEPVSCGIGGDLFVIYWDAKTGKLTGLNASGWAPRGLTIEFLKAQGRYAMPQDGIQSVTVPGCVNGWEKFHKRFGRLSWRELFQPAIYYAEEGFSGNRDHTGYLEVGDLEVVGQRRRRPPHLPASRTRFRRWDKSFRQPAVGRGL